MNGARARIARLAIPLLIGLLLLAGVAFAIGDARAFLDQLRDVRPAPFAAAVALTVVSFAAFHLSVLAYAKAAAIAVPPWRSFPATWVSQAVNNVVSTGGLAGTTLRAIGYSRLGTSPGSATSVSAMSTLAGDLVNFLGVFFALALVAWQGHASSRVGVWSVVASAAFIAAWVALHVWLRDGSRREAARIRIDRLAQSVAARMGLAGRDAVDAFRRDTIGGFDVLLARPIATLPPLLLVIADLVLRAAVLHASFLAIGHDLPFSVTLSGWMIGVAAGALSLIPAGIGALEGSMTATFAWLGVPLPVAAAAIVVFRFAYYVIPIAISPLLSRAAFGRKGAA